MLGLLLLLSISTALAHTTQCEFTYKKWPESACRAMPGSFARCQSGEIAACCNEEHGCARYKCGSPGVHHIKDCPWTNYYLACCPWD